MSTYHPNFGSSGSGGGGLGSVFKSITKTFKTSSTRNVPVTINPTVVGGGQELQHIIQQLETTTSNSTRLSALNKLTDSIYKYLISSVPEIWYLVHHYCEYNNSKYSRDVRRAALKLLTACIKKMQVQELDLEYDILMILIPIVCFKIIEQIRIMIYF